MTEKRTVKMEKTGIKYRKLRALHHDTKAPIPSFNSLFPCLRSRSVRIKLTYKV